MRSVFLFVLFVLFLSVLVNGFKCQATIDAYNAHVNVGNFTGAAALTFDDNVTYVIPGPAAPTCPYCAVYKGKDSVVSLFVDGFLGHFTIYNPLVNMREITTDDGGVGGVPELLDFNDESFRVLPQYGGRYFRVPVIHDFLFDPNTCLITQMYLYQDPYTVATVFAGYPSVAHPMMPALAQIPPASSFVVNSAQGLLNWQYVPGEDRVQPEDAWSVISKYYELVSSNTLDNTTASQVFFGLDYSIPQAMTAILVPGDPEVLPFASLYLGLDEVVQYHQRLDSSVQQDSPFSDPRVHNVTDHGSVVMQYKLTGYAKGTNLAFSCDATDYFQLVQEPSSGDTKIIRLTRFFDTWNVTMAVTNNVPFPQKQTRPRWA